MEEFQSNNMNKKNIDLLRERLNYFGVKTAPANGDADLLIAQTAIAKTLDIAVNVSFDDFDDMRLL